MRPGLPVRPGLPPRPRIGVSVRPPLPIRAPPKPPPTWPPPKPPPNPPRASAVLEPRVAAAIVAAAARAKVRVSLRDMVVLRVLGLGQIQFQCPWVGAAGKRFTPRRKKMRGVARALVGKWRTARRGGRFWQPHQTLTSGSGRGNDPAAADLPGAGRTGTLGPPGCQKTAQNFSRLRLNRRARVRD